VLAQFSVNERNDAEARHDAPGNTASDASQPGTYNYEPGETDA